MSDTQHVIGATGKTVRLEAYVISTGLPYTAGAWNTAGITATYSRDFSTPVAITPLSAGTIGTYASGSFVHRGQGTYSLGAPDAAFLTGTDGVEFEITGIPDVVFRKCRVELFTTNPRTAAATIDTRATDIQARIPATLTANGNMRASLVEILTTVLTETSGQIAAAFRQFFNIASPTSTMNLITTVGTTTNVTNAPTSGDLTATMKASVTTAATAATPNLNVAYDAAKTAASGTALSALDTKIGTPITSIAADVATRLPTASYVAPVSAAAVRTEMDANSTRLANLDVAVGSRLAAASYLSPDNTTIATINSKVGTPSVSVAADVAAVKSDTSAALTRLPSALTANGNMRSSVVEWITTALTEGAVGRVAAAFRQFFDIASPTGTVNLIPTVTTLTNAPTTGDLTATMKASVTTAAQAATPNLNAAYDAAKTAASATALSSLAQVVGNTDSVVSSLTSSLPGSVVVALKADAEWDAVFSHVAGKYTATYPSSLPGTATILLYAADATTVLKTLTLSLDASGRVTQRTVA